MDKDDKIEEDNPTNYRQVSLSLLNSTISLTSTHDSENIDFLLDRSLFVLDKMKKDNGGS